MKKKLVSGLGVMVTTSALMAAAVPASAADTAVTFSLSGGLLTVSAASSAALGTKASGTTSVAGLLGETKVTDDRGGTVGWSATALTSVFDNATATAPATTTATAVSYNSGLVTFTGVVVPVTSGPTTLSTTTAAKVVEGTAVVGNNTATWNPTLTITLPSSSTVGDYKGTITTSVL